MRRRLGALAAAAAAALAAGPAHAEFPYPTPASDPYDYKQYRLADGAPRPNDLTGSNEWIFSATPEPGNEPVNSSPQELNGIRGDWMADMSDAPDTAWETTTGRPDVVIATLDSGIDWSDVSAMNDLRKKTHLNRGELPVPEIGGPAKEGVDCSQYRSGEHDANFDGAFNVMDYACDPRVSVNAPNSVGPTNVIDPQDVLIAFSNGTDGDANGFVDDMVGWDFMDNDNDPYDDVHYGHGTGEAEDSAGEANNGGTIAGCANCMVMHMRVGDSFIADANRFAQAVIYATDNDALVVQEALGTLNNTRLSRASVEYAYRHGVTVIASAADEAAQHHNWPSSLPHVIVVNSVTKYDSAEVPKSYLYFNGCTNFSSKITIAIPSTSCSSDATAKAAGIAGIVYSAALNARNRGDLDPHPTCRRTNGRACVVSANEVRQLMASGTVGGKPLADDVDFATKPEPTCAVPEPGCSDPNAMPGNWAMTSLLPGSRRYPSRAGHDQFFGWGRVNANSAVDTVTGAAKPPTQPVAVRLPPEAEIISPDWFTQVDPARTPAVLDVRGDVAARSFDRYTCRVYAAVGSYPNNSEHPVGDFKAVGAADDWCNGAQRSQGYSGLLAKLDLNELKSRFPPNAAGFNGREPGIGTAQTSNGRPNTEPYGFVVKVVVSASGGGKAYTGEDRRNLYLHRDQDMKAGFPKQIADAGETVRGGDGESSPLFADLDGDNRNELLLATADGSVHAYRPDGTELPGWPARGDALPLHTGGRAFESGAISPEASRGAFLASLAAGDLDHDGVLEVVGADFEGKVYVWDAEGRRVFKREANPNFSGKPLVPFQNVRRSERDRVQHGFIASPVLADIDRNDDGKLEIIAASMDRHVYAWNDDGSAVPGYPVLVVDYSKVATDANGERLIDPTTHMITWGPGAGQSLQQGPIVDTPAVADLAGDARPEIVVGTNEEYAENSGNEGPLNAGAFNTASVALLAQSGQLKLGNSRLYAIKPGGDPDGDPRTGEEPWLTGWPFKVGKIFLELLPIVGEGITGAPVIGPSVSCPQNSTPGRIVGVIPDAGLGYLVKADGKSCYGQDGGKDRALQTDVAAGSGKYDTPAFPAVGHPAFGQVGGQLAFLAPLAGLRRALDLGLNGYQGGQDFVGAWDPVDGQFRPGWPTPVNDLQFLTGPSVADIDGLPGDETVSGTAYLDLAAFGPTGAPANQKWPKLTSDWMVANPLIGSWGTLDTDAAAKKVVVATTRIGTILAYDLAAGPCTSASWPRFHHDNANSGSFDRDATLPGKPLDAKFQNGTLSWTAPGDDLLCGTAAAYELVTSDAPITAANFAAATPIADPPAPKAPGQAQDFIVPSTAKRYVAVRARDEQGNVGRPAAVDTAPAEHGGGGETPSETTPGGGGTGQPGGGPGQPGGGPNPGTAPVVPGSGRPPCLASRLRVGALGVGRLRLGHDRRLVLKRVGRPRAASRRGDVWSWCVRGGGRVSAVFVNGRIRLVVSTARGHEAAGAAGPRDRVSRLRRVYPGSSRFGSGVWFTHRSSRVVFRVRRGRVTAVGVADRRGIKDPRLLKAYLRRARV